jgi:hypothetical protein
MTNVMWQLIENAWNQDPAARPSMLQLEERLRSMDTANISNQQHSNIMSGHHLTNWELVEPSIPQEEGSNHPRDLKSYRTSSTSLFACSFSLDYAH